MSKINLITQLFFSILAIIHAILGLWWLAAWWVIIIGLHFVSTSRQLMLVTFRKKSWVAYSFILPGVFILAIGLRVLVFGVFYIPSSSMERTILPGDVVWGNKLIYGPSLPQSPYEIPWINLFTWLIEGSKADLERKWWEPKRLQGYGKTNPGDIVVFEDPENKEVMIKRCMGTPGDTIRIVKGQVYINNKLHDETGNLLLYSRVDAIDSRHVIHALDSLAITRLSYQPAHLNDYISLYLTKEEIGKISQFPGIAGVSIEKERPDTAWWVYPHHYKINWSIDDYGPFVIPKKGMKILLTPENWILYGNLINKYESSGGICENEGNFLYKEIQMTSYTFQNDYYFMLGDHRHDSRDSRYFGPITDEMIICKATIVIYSRDQNISKFSRILKTLK